MKITKVTPPPVEPPPVTFTIEGLSRADLVAVKMALEDGQFRSRALVSARSKLLTAIHEALRPL